MATLKPQEEDIQDYESDTESVHSETSEEMPEEVNTQNDLCESIILTGDSEEDLFRMNGWTDEHGERVPVTHSYVTVYHSQNFCQWWLNKMVEDVLLKNVGNLEGKKSVKKKVYYWNYQVYGNGPEDPGRWKLVIPTNKQIDSGIHSNLRCCGAIRIEVDYNKRFMGRCLVYMYFKSSYSFSTYQHHMGQYKHYLTWDEIEKINIPNKEDFIV